jgi:CheY-like chemotaxis protein
MVEDQDHDVEFIQRAFKRAGVDNPVKHVPNGEEAIAYLTGLGRYADRTAYPRPRVIITDLKMPRMGGIELLQWLHAHPQSSVVPTIVLTSSELPSDIALAYQNGAAGYFVKPESLSDLERLMRIIAEYWRAGKVPAGGNSGSAGPSP